MSQSNINETAWTVRTRHLTTVAYQIKLMMHKITLTASLIALVLIAAPSLAAEVRTYQFTPDGSLPFRAMFFPGIGNVFGRLADVSGTFTVSLDVAAGTGKLVSLNEELVNVSDLVPSPTTFQLVPVPAPNSGERVIVSSLPAKLPPLEGILEQSGDELHLFSSGVQPVGDQVEYLPQFSIRMRNQHATFSMALPFELSRAVSNAQAIQVVPEPSALALAVAATLALGTRGNRRA